MTTELSGLVAVDAGGTSTRALVLDPGGQALGYAEAGRGNPTAVGPQAAVASVAESVSEALARAQVPGRKIGLVALAMAGSGSTPVAPEIRRGLAGIGIEAPLALESDLLAAYFSGTPRPDGYAVVAGTGAGAIRVEGGRQVAAADGLGWLLGDEGSGFWIGRRVVRATLADLDGRGPSTALTPLLLARLGVSEPPATGGRETILAVVRALYAGPPVRLADFAGLVFEADADGIADEILDEAARALVRTLNAVRSPTISGPVVLGGGVLARGHQLTERLTAACEGEEVRVVADGTVGVGVLALRHSGTTIDEAVFHRLGTSLTSVR